MSSNSRLPVFSRQLDPRLDRVLAPMCTALPLSEVESLKQAVLAHVSEVRAATASNEFLDVAAAERAAHVLLELLDGYARYPEPHRSLIVGAARYFVREQDVEPDTGSLLGFDDDVMVLNFVLETIGRADLRVEA